MLTIVAQIPPPRAKRLGKCLVHFERSCPNGCTRAHEAMPACAWHAFNSEDGLFVVLQEQPISILLPFLALKPVSWRVLPDPRSIPAAGRSDRGGEAGARAQLWGRPQDPPAQPPLREEAQGERPSRTGHLFLQSDWGKHGRAGMGENFWAMW